MVQWSMAHPYLTFILVFHTVIVTMLTIIQVAKIITGSKSSKHGI